MRNIHSFDKSACHVSKRQPLYVGYTISDFLVRQQQYENRALKTAAIVLGLIAVALAYEAWVCR